MRSTSGRPRALPSAISRCWRRAAPSTIPSCSPPFGLDARDPTFWQGGLGVIERMIDELEGLEANLAIRRNSLSHGQCRTCVAKTNVGQTGACSLYSSITWREVMSAPPRDTQIEGYVLQVKKIGNSVGLILPRELLARLKLKEGDKLHVVEQPERGLKLSPYDPDARQGHGDCAACHSENIATPTRRLPSERAAMARHGPSFSISMPSSFRCSGGRRRNSRSRAARIRAGPAAQQIAYGETDLAA